MSAEHFSSRRTESAHCVGDLCARIDDFRQLGGFALTHDGWLLAVDNEEPGRESSASRLHAYDALSTEHRCINDSASVSELPARVHAIAHHPHTTPPLVYSLQNRINDVARIEAHVVLLAQRHRLLCGVDPAATVDTADMPRSWHCGGITSCKDAGMTAVNITGHNFLVASTTTATANETDHREPNDATSDPIPTASHACLLSGHMYALEDFFHSTHSTHPDHGKPCVVARIAPTKKNTDRRVWECVVTVPAADPMDEPVRDSASASAVTLATSDIAVLPFSTGWSPINRGCNLDPPDEYVLVLGASDSAAAGEIHVLNGSDGAYLGQWHVQGDAALNAPHGWLTGRLWPLLTSTTSAPLYSLVAVSPHNLSPFVYLYDERHHRVVCCRGSGESVHAFSCDALWSPKQYSAFLMEVSPVTGWLYIALYESGWRSLLADLTRSRPTQHLQVCGGQIVVIK